MQNQARTSAKLAQVEALLDRLLKDAVHKQKVPEDTTVATLTLVIRSLAKRGQHLEASQRVEEQLEELHQTLTRGGAPHPEELSQRLQEHLAEVRQRKRKPVCH